MRNSGISKALSTGKIRPNYTLDSGQFFGLGPEMVFLSKIPLHATRYAHQKLNPLVYPTLSINEFPKSGGTWVCRMLRDVTGWRFDDNSIPLPGAAIVKYHRLPLSVRPLALIVRDPRDVFVSLFHHSKAVFKDDPFNSTLVKAWREVFLQTDDESEQLQAFIERQLTRPVYPRFGWSAFYEHYLSCGLPIFRYEDFRTKTAATLSSLLGTLGVEAGVAVVERISEAHSIEKILAQRAEKGDTGAGNFIRRGKVGGYADVLPRDAIGKIEQAEGTTMSKFGYL